MRIAERIYLVGSGAAGFDLTDAFDCHVFLVDGGDELALLDVGAGMGAEAIVSNVRDHGLDPEAVRHVVLTHAHGDHAGGAARMRELLPRATFYAHPTAAAWIRAGDEAGTSVAPAKVAGIYPADYVLRPAQVDEELVEGDRLRVGAVELEVLETPGHADGLVSLLLEEGGTRTLFSSDAVFWGGHILLQAIHDCRLDAQVATLRKLRGLAIDALLPGHLAFALHDGQRHVERANDALDRLLPPNQLFDAW